MRRQSMRRAARRESAGREFSRVDVAQFGSFSMEKSVPLLHETGSASAMTAIEIFIPFGRIGSLAPCLAGGSPGNHLAHSSFIPAKSDSSARMKVALTTLARE